jgi:penicillin amidase
MMRNGIAACLFLVLLAGCAGAPPEDRRSGAAGETVTVYRDTYGTPHVVAESNRGVFFGYGYAVATDRLFQMEMLRRTAEGRVAEVLGADFLPLDIRLRTSYDHRSVRRQLDALPAAQREILAAYAAGFNARVDEVLAAPDDWLPVEFLDHGFRPQHWDAYDVAMTFVGSIAHRYADFNSERDNLALLRGLEARHGKAVAWRLFNASKWLLDSDSPTTVPRADAGTATGIPPRPAYLDTLPEAVEVARLVTDAAGRFAGFSDQPGLAERHRARLLAAGHASHPEFAAASNYWAMNDLADAAGALVNGPQFGFSTPGYVYGIGLHGGDFDVVGNTLLALPCLLFAHNNRLAWGSTAGISDQTDEFALQLAPGNPDRYRHGDGWRDFERWSEEIAVKGAAPVTVTARRSVHGMVQQYDAAGGTAWVRARAWEGQELATLMAWVLVATEQTLEGAEQRIGDMANNINMYTMDHRGRLGYVHSGRYPRRAADHDPRLPAPGSGSWDWQGLRPYADNPKMRDPGQGYVANWNNRPAADWISSDLWIYTWSRADRVQILVDELEAMRGGTVAQLRDINRHSSFADVNAPFMLPYLFEAWSGATPDAAERDALQLLRGWDQRWHVDGEGAYGPAATLMESWLRTLLEDALRDDVGDEWFHLYAATNYPHHALGPSIPNPPGIKALLRTLDQRAAGAVVDYDFFNGVDPLSVLRGSFSAAVRELAALQGADSNRWRLQAHPMQWLPYNFRGVPQAREDNVASLPAYMNRGSENNLFVATGEGIVAQDVIPPGQSGFVNGAALADTHSRDQMSLYAGFGHKAVPFSLEAVRAAAVSQRTLRLP